MCGVGVTAMEDLVCGPGKWKMSQLRVCGLGLERGQTNMGDGNVAVCYKLPDQEEVEETFFR